MKRFPIKEIPLLVFGILWILFLFVDYVNKHPVYLETFEYFQLPKLSIAILVVSLLMGFLTRRSGEKINKYLFNGLGVLFLFFIASIIISLSFSPFADTPTSPIEALPFAFKGLALVFPLVFVLISSYSLGSFSLSRFKVEIKASSRPIIAVAIGIMLLTFGFFILAIVGFLYSYSVLPLLVIPILINIKGAFGFTKKLFITPWGKGKFGFFSGFLISLLTFYLAINYLSAISPFPAGFDSRNYYVNISKLLDDYHGLVEGFQPYNWSLFMSLGIVGFKSIALTLLISFSSFLLSLWAGYELSRNYLNLSLPATLFTLLGFSLLPANFNQMFIELKIDFGLLFIQLCSIFLLLELLKAIKAKGKVEGRQVWTLVVLIAIFCGYGIGVKLTHLYLIFSMMLLLWAIYTRYFGFMAVFFFILFVVFIGGLDEVSGMSKYHLGIPYQKYIFLGLSIICFIISFLKNRENFIGVFKLSTVLSIVAMLVFSPWVIKNGFDARRLDARTLIMGEKPGPNVTMKSIKQNLNKPKREK